MTFYARSSMTATEAGDQIAVPFPYIEQAHVKLYINELLADGAITWLSAGLIEYDTPWSEGDIIEVRRETPLDVAERAIPYTHQRGSVAARQVNINNLADLYRAQEILDAFSLLSAGEGGGDGGVTAGQLAAAVSNRVKLDATNMNSTSAIALRPTLWEFDIPVERFGAVANSSGTDNAAAIQAGEDHCAANGGNLVFRSNASYYFKDTLTIIRQNPAWLGYNTRLIYNGASTTKDLIRYGTPSPAAQLKGGFIDGFILQSVTKMTGGTAFWARNTTDNHFGITFQTQQGAETLGNQLYHGFWGDMIATSKLKGLHVVAQKDGIRINGQSGKPQSDFWVDVHKIMGCDCGVRLGGGFGGLYLSPETTLIANGSHLICDQSLVAELNRELFATGTVFDVTGNYGGTVTWASSVADAGIIFKDGDLLAELNGIWCSGGHGANIWVQSTSDVKLIATGRIFNCAAHATNGQLGDGIQVDSAGAYVTFGGGQIQANAGWGINPTVASNVTQYAGTQFWGNGLGEVNPTYGAAQRIWFSPTLSTSVMGTNNLICGVPGNVNFAMLFADPTTRAIPVLQFDAFDYMQYIRSTNVLETYIGGTKRTTLDSISLSLDVGLRTKLTATVVPNANNQVVMHHPAPTTLRFTVQCSDGVTRTADLTLA